MRARAEKNYRRLDREDFADAQHPLDRIPESQKYLGEGAHRRLVPTTTMKWRASGAMAKRRIIFDATRAIVHLERRHYLGFGLSAWHVADPST
jgi:hypothetical protein